MADVLQLMGQYGAIRTLSNVAVASKATGVAAVDSANFLSAITRAGVNGCIYLPANQIYVVDRNIGMLAGQILYGNGSTLKRAAQVITTTSTTITATTTNQLMVASTNGMLVGQQYSLWQAATYDTTNPTITSIVGNVVTFGWAFATSFSGTTTVYQVFETLTVQDRCVVRDLTFDGNNSNWTYAHWEYCTEIGIYSNVNHPVVENCFLHDIPGEGLQEHGGSGYSIVDATYRNLRVLNAKGNGIHLSGSNGTKIIAPWIKNTNLDTTMGHVSGCIGFSLWTNNWLIRDFYCENGNCGIGVIGDSTNTNGLIANGVITGCTSYGIGGEQNTNSAASNVAIDNVQIFSCPEVRIRQSSSGSTSWPTNWRLSNIFLSGTKLNLIGCDDMELANVSVDLTGDTSSSSVNIDSCKRLTFASGSIKGGDTGVYLTNNYSRSAGVTIETGVSCYNQHSQGVYIDVGLPADTTVSTDVGSGAASASWWNGVLANSGQVIGARIVCGGASNNGIYLYSNNTIARGCRVSGSGSNSVLNRSGSTGIVIMNNMVFTAVNNAGGAGNPNVSDNIVV